MKTTNQGQSTIEFLFAFIFIVGFFVAFLQLGLNMGLGYLAHYATYMSSRVFLVHDYQGGDENGSDPVAANEASREFRKYIPLGNPQFNFPSGFATARHHFVGAFYNFQKKMTLFSSLGGSIGLDLKSESFLGKEPTRATCWRRTCDALAGAMEGDQVCSTLKNHITVFDDGC